MKIYLAGPDVFRFNAKAHGENLKLLCKEHGHEGLFPLDNEVDLEDPTVSQKIFQGNWELIKECDMVLANIEPFRGPGADPGTAWEMGAAFALDKKVVAYTDTLENYEDRVMAISGTFSVIEKFGLQDNLMLIHSSDGVFSSFEEALISLNANPLN